MSTQYFRVNLALILFTVISTPTLFAQMDGTVRGTVSLVNNGDPVHGAVVLIVGPGLVALTDDAGTFEINNVPAGSHEIFAQREHLAAGRQTITVVAGGAAKADFLLELSPVHEEVTVTATATRSTALEAFNATTTIDSFDLTANPVGTLGEAIQYEPGIAVRSFGPGSSRPIIRGFDGDRVLILEDGIRTGDLSSQSGDHGVSIDPTTLDRIEVVRGPATLLYGSNAVGGIVNAISPHESYRDSSADSTRAQLSTDVGSANSQLGTNANVQHGENNFLVWAGGGGRRTEDYDTPEGTIENSATRLSNARAGIGYFSDRFFASGGFTMEDSRFGIPFAAVLHHEEHPEETALGTRNVEEKMSVAIDSLRRVGRFDVGMRDLNNDVVDAFRIVINAVDFVQDEIESGNRTETIGTTFNNQTYIVRAEIDQRQTARIAGKFGVWTQLRDYVSEGAEALAPPTEQVGVAAFAYEEISLGRYRIQIGGRIEQNDYTVVQRGDEDSHNDGWKLRDRSFRGGSASVGFHATLAAGNVFVANLTRSHRAPALEELYNFGPHVGNLIFEVGNSSLEAETTVGLDLNLRHQSTRMRGDANFYVYDIDGFIFASVTDEVIDNLRVAEFLQGNSRFIGFDAKSSIRLVDSLWLNFGLGFVNAKLVRQNEALPRIPPIRTTISIDVPYHGLTITPEWTITAKQSDTFRNETSTDGYSVFNIRASHVWPRQHLAHVLTASAFNLTDKLYRHHTSFIKDLAPQIGRGVKVGYSVRFF